MRSKKEVKADLLTALEAEGDAPLRELGFKRSKRSVHYKRKGINASHIIAFFADFFPPYRPGAEALILPRMHLLMPSVSERALDLVEGNEILLAARPEVIINQPIEWAAPKGHRPYWYATGPAEFQDRVRKIVVFIQTWVNPFLDDLTGPESLTKLYLQDDPRLILQQFQYIYVVAAFDILGRREQACSVLETKLGKPGLRREFAVAFENLGLGARRAE
jgi:hypothetical protein